MIRAPLCGLALALIPGVAPAAPLSDADFLSAFAVACLDGYRDPEARSRAIDAAGWAPVADDANPMLSRMLEIARRDLEQTKAEEGFVGSDAVYGRSGGATGPYLVTTELALPEEASWSLDLLGCYLYDFEATTPLDPAPITARFAEEPAEVEDQPGIIISQMWAVEALDGVWELRSTFIPEDSPGVDVTGFSGRVMILTSTRE